MSDLLRAAVRVCWVRNEAYALRLVGDLSDPHMIAQPAPGRVINHPAWILSHLNVYMPLIAAVLGRGEVEDPVTRPHARGSRVTLKAGDYLPREALVAEYTRLHGEATAALDGADAGVFERANPVERMRGNSPTVGVLLMTLMVKHESFHLGQLSAWRRGMGLASVEM